QTHAGCSLRRRDVYPGDDRMRVQRAQDRQMKRAGQSYVVDIASLAGEEFVIFAPAERPANIGRGLHCFGHRRRLQKLSTHGRSSTSKDQALRGWRRISI